MKTKCVSQRWLRKAISLVKWLRYDVGVKPHIHRVVKCTSKGTYQSS